jgi:hypothetical protein
MTKRRAIDTDTDNDNDTDPDKGYESTDIRRPEKRDTQQLVLDNVCSFLLHPVLFNYYFGALLYI